MNIQTVIAKIGNTTVIAIPTKQTKMNNQMGDDEYNCLKKCVKIEDIEKRLQCAVLCPVSKNYQMVFR